MRVTNNITTRQFLTNNNRLLTHQLQSENRIATQRRFNRVSEDPINGSKAMTVRRQLRDNAIYKDNLSAAKQLFSAAEINLTSVAHTNYIKVEEKLVAAANGTWEQSQLDIYATELEQIAEQMVKTLNGDFSERVLFGGASNGKTPFQIQRAVVTDEGGNIVFPPNANKYYNVAADGTVSLKEGVKMDDIPRTVTYNGVPLDFDVTSDMILPDGRIMKPTAGKSYTVTAIDEKTQKWSDEVIEIKSEDVDEAIEKSDNSLMYPGSKPVYVDIGIGIKYNSEYEVDPQTALDVSMNGAAITGNGIDIDGMELSGTVRKAVGDTTFIGLSVRNGYPPYSFNNISLTIAGTQLTARLDETNAPVKPDGGVYTNAEITALLNNVVSDAYKAESGKELPADVRFSIDDNNSFVIESENTEITVDFPTLGIEAGEVPVVNEGKVAMDEDGNLDLSERFSKNLMQLVIDAADALKRGDRSTVNAIIDRANEANNHILTEITTLGTKQNSIEFYESKNEDYKYNLLDRQNVVEGTDMEEEIINYYAVKAAYDATLKMGSQILPHSILDFI